MGYYTLGYAHLAPSHLGGCVDVLENNNVIDLTASKAKVAG